MQLLCSFRVFMAARLLIGIALLCSFAYGQQPDSSWQAELRKSAAAQDWTAAMGIVDRELARAPQDIEVRAWRARILTWSGSLAEAEHEYRDIVAAVPNDPDYWMGLGTVYSREGRTQDAVQCLKRAVELDPHRADLRSAYGRVLRDAHSRTEAKSQFQQAVQLDPTSAEARAGLLSLRSEPKHELRVGTDTDFFNFTDANHDEGIALTSDWSSRWKTGLAWDSYQRGGTLAEKFTGSITAKLRDHRALTVGGATARDNGVVPQCEAFFNYDRGWARKREGFLQGLEIVYGQHWCWYTTARIFTLNGNAIFYLPHDWTWSLAINEAQSNFYGAGTAAIGASRLDTPGAIGLAASPPANWPDCIWKCESRLPLPFDSRICPCNDVAMADRNLQIVRFVGSTPSMAYCDVCKLTFRTRPEFLIDADKAKHQLQSDFEQHECKPEEGAVKDVLDHIR